MKKGVMNRRIYKNVLLRKNTNPNTFRVKLFINRIVLLRNSLKNQKKKWLSYFFSDIYFCPFFKTSRENFIIGPSFPVFAHVPFDYQKYHFKMTA
jgi:hypothetical protein